MEAKIKTIGCKDCHNQGYLIYTDDEYSYAKTCECVNKCEACNGTGFISYKNENNYDVLTTCSNCGRLRSNIKKYNPTKIPAKFSNVLMVDTYKPKSKHQQMALKYVKDSFIKNYPNEKGYLLMGQSGVGKTHLAIGTVSELTIEKGVSCLFKDFFLLLSDLKQAYSEGISEKEILQPLLESEVLVIDEMGKGKCNEWELNILDQLISNRYNSSKKTLITTNYFSKEYLGKNQTASELLEERIGERIYSRLHEMCNFVFIEGNDHRKLKN